MEEARIMIFDAIGCTWGKLAILTFNDLDFHYKKDEIFRVMFQWIFLFWLIAVLNLMEIK